MDIRFTETIDDEEFETSLEDSDTLEHVIYLMAELYDTSPFIRGKIQDGFATFGLLLKKVQL